MVTVASSSTLPMSWPINATDVSLTYDTSTVTRPSATDVSTESGASVDRVDGAACGRS